MSNSKKRSRSQNLSANEVAIANTIEKEINEVFTVDITNCNRIKMDTFINNPNIINEYITYLNRNIKEGIITFRDINYVRKGKIINISLDKDNSNNIEIIYNNDKDTGKTYKIIIKFFIEHIYIVGNTIFYLEPAYKYKYRQENTPIFNNVNQTYININYFQPVKKSFVTPSRRSIKTLTSGKPFYRLSTDRQLKYSRESDANIKLITDISYLKQKFKGSNIDTYIEELRNKLLLKATNENEKEQINDYFNKLKKRYYDDINMPPPPPSKRTRLEGGNIKPIKKVRKVYSDNNNRKYIKYNKNIIIYLNL